MHKKKPMQDKKKKAAPVMDMAVDKLKKKDKSKKPACKY